MKKMQLTFTGLLLAVLFCLCPQAIATPPSPDQVIAMMDAGEWEKALNISTQMTLSKPQSAKAWLLKARAEARLEQYAKASISLNTAKSLPQWTELNMKVPVKDRDVIDQTVTKNPTLALGMVADGLLAYPGNAQLLYLKALAHDRLGQVEQARTALAQAKVAQPNLDFAEKERLNRLEEHLGLKQQSSTKSVTNTGDLSDVRFTNPPEESSAINVWGVLLGLTGLGGVGAGGYLWWNKRRRNKITKLERETFQTFARTEDRFLNSSIERAELNKFGGTEASRQQALSEQEIYTSLLTSLWNAEKDIKEEGDSTRVINTYRKVKEEALRNLRRETSNHTPEIKANEFNHSPRQAAHRPSRTPETAQVHSYTSKQDQPKNSGANSQTGNTRRERAETYPTQQTVVINQVNTTQTSPPSPRKEETSTYSEPSRSSFQSKHDDDNHRSSFSSSSSSFSSSSSNSESHRSSFSDSSSSSFSSSDSSSSSSDSSSSSSDSSSGGGSDW